MGCFFACFRIKEDEKRRKKPNSIPSKSRDPVVSKNQLASVFAREEKDSAYEQATDLSSQEKIDKHGVDGGLKNEETPAEVQKRLKKINSQTTNDDGLSSNPRPKCSPYKKLGYGEHHGEISDSPAQLNKYLERHENTSEGSCKSEEHQTSRKVMRFEGPGVESESRSVDLDTSPSQTNGHILPFSAKHSPYPTPMNLTEEMQTPATAYPDNLPVKNARIRTQFVCPVLNPVENSTQWTTQRADSNHFTKSSDPSEHQNSVVNREQVINVSEGSNAGTPLDRRAQLNFNPDMIISKEQSSSQKSPNADRPIIGMVAAHWSDGEPSNTSHKWWDGNGIPNSTNKYKEDQKVSWHATPFEVRLEKALSDEKLFPARNQLDGKLMEFENEGEESDTAAS